jgi:capsular polysaccharide transport system permease protein
MILTVGVTALWSLFHGRTPVPIAAFAVSGYSMVLLWRSTVNSCIWAVAANTALLHHRNVKVLDLFISRILVGIPFRSSSCRWSTLGLMATPGTDGILVGWLALCGSPQGGHCVSAASTYGELSGLPGSWLLLLPSGAKYIWKPQPIAALPCVPTVHGVEMMRKGSGGGCGYYDIWFLLASAIVTLLGLVLLAHRKSNRCE